MARTRQRAKSKSAPSRAGTQPSGYRRKQAPTPGGTLARNHELIRERLEYEIRLGLDFIEEQVGKLFPGPLGAILNPIAKLFYRFAAKDAAIRRAHKQLDLYIECAERFDGKSLDALVEENFERFLETEEIVARGNRRHRRWKEVLAIEKEIFRERLTPLIRLAREGRGETYEELTRSVFPKRKEAEEVLRRQVELVQRLMDLVREEPGLAPIPAMLRPMVLNMLDAGVDFARETLRKQLDETYGKAP